MLRLNCQFSAYRNAPVKRVPPIFSDCVDFGKKRKASKTSHTNGFKGRTDTKSKNVYPLFLQKQAHGTQCRRRSVNGTVSRNGSSQFSDAYSCDFKQLGISNLRRKSCRNPCFRFLESRKTCTPYFSEKSKNVYPLFFRKIPLKSLSDVFYVNSLMSFVAMDSSSFFVILARAHARARTHAEMFLVSIT